MPFSMQDSIRIGPFRFSKTGAGLLVASKLGNLFGPPRAHHIKIGRVGVHYQGSFRTPAQPSAVSFGEPVSPRSIWAGSVEMVEVDSSDVLQMRDEAFGSILDEINAKAGMARLATILPALTIIIAIVAALVVKTELISLILVAIPLWLGGKWFDASLRATVLLYDFIDDTAGAFGWMTETFDFMMECSGKWHIAAGGAVRDLATWKQNAGAAHLVQRSPTSLSYGLPPTIKSNITPPALQVGSQTIYFLPDVALVQAGHSFGAVGYGDLRLSWQPSHSIEYGEPPDDAQIVDYRWEHPNKNGGPDRRYRSNRQVPVCAYEAMHIVSPSGLNELVEFSRPGVAQEFIAATAYLPRQSFKSDTLALR